MWSYGVGLLAEALGSLGSSQVGAPSTYGIFQLSRRAPFEVPNGSGGHGVAGTWPCAASPRSKRIAPMPSGLVCACSK